MSIFASDTQETIALPMDPPHTVTIRKLRGGEYEQAQVDGLKRSARSWADQLQVAVNTGRLEDLKTKVNDPLFGFDRVAVIQAGLMAWTYDDPPTPARIADLDDEAMEFLARAILTLTKPAVTQKETLAPASGPRAAGAAAA